MDAPTLKIQELLQETLVRELHSRGEHRAAVWYEDTWTKEHGNYTNASAGYCGNRTSAGCEVRWRYMWRDTVGTCGTNQRVSMSVFGPCMVKYVSDLSESVVEKLLDAEFGVYRFPSLPTIDRKMWKEVQQFDISRLILAEIEGNAASRDQWEHELHFFHPLEDAIMEEEALSVTQMLKLYHDGGRTIGMPRRDVLGVLMLTKSLLDQLEEEIQTGGLFAGEH